MFKFLKRKLKEWLDWKESIEIEEMRIELDAMKIEYSKMRKIAYDRSDELSAELMRNILGSISHNLKEPQRTPEEFKQYNARLVENWDVIKPLLNQLESDQNEAMIKIAEKNKQFMFSKGTLNGISLVKEILEEAYSEHTQKTPEPKKFNKISLFPEP